MATTPAPTSVVSVTPSVGLVTWDSEGQEGGPFHSRKLHVPSTSSGLTIGRGYDMKERKAAGIIQDLTASDVGLTDATTLSAAAGLSGEAAKDFITEHGLEDFEISKLGQKLLFLRTYEEIKADVKRICGKADVAKKYGATDWNKLHPAIVDILVDLRFRGDYTSNARALIQKTVAKNDLVAFAKVLKQASHWTGVPSDRFNRRVAYLNKALAAHKAAAPAAKPLEAQPAHKALPTDPPKLSLPRH